MWARRDGPLARGNITSRTYAWLIALLLAMAFGFSLGWVMGNNHATDKAFEHDLPLYHDLKAKGWAH